MKSLLEEDPSELMGLEEENDPMEIGGEDEEEEPRELMGLGDEEDEEDESFDSDSDEEEEPAELLGLDEEDDEEEEGEEVPQYVRQRVPGLRLAQGLKAKRRARVIAVAALRARRRAKVLALALVRRRRRGRLLALAALRARRRTTTACGRRPQGTQAGPRAHSRSRPCTAPNPFAQAGSDRSEAPRVRVNRTASTQRVALDSELRASVQARSSGATR